MSLGTLLAQIATVTPRASGTEDDYGTPVLTAGTQVDYPCRLEPAGSSENVAGQDRVATDATAYLPGTAVVHHLDAVSIEGIAFEVVGEPGLQRSPRGAHHLVVALRRIQGG